MGNTKQRRNQTLIIAVCAIAIVASLMLYPIFTKPSSASDNGVAGWSAKINYSDGTSTTVYSTGFDTALSFVYYNDRASDSIDFYLLLKFGRSVTGGYSGTVTFSFDGELKQTLPLSQSVNLVADTTLKIFTASFTSQQIMDWVGPEQTSNSVLEAKILVDSVIVGSETVFFNGQAYQIPLKVDTTTTPVEPPVVPEPPVTPPPEESTVFFNEGFETSLASWEIYLGGASDTVTRVTTPYVGSYSAQCQTNGDGTDWAFISHAFTAKDGVNATFAFQMVDDNIPVGSRNLVASLKADGGYLIDLYVDKPVAGSLRWAVNFLDGVGTYSFIPSTAGPVVGSWVQLSLIVTTSGTDGSVSLQQGSTTLLSYTGLVNDGYGLMNAVCFGLRAQYPPTPAYSSTVRIDAVYLTEP